MLARLQKFFQENLAAQTETSGGRNIELAAAALMIELSKADFSRDEAEQRHIAELLRRHFGVADHDIEQLMALAEEEFETNNALHPFTRLINEHYDPAQKVALVEVLWELALADGEIHKYEDHLIRKVADLIYVPHRDFIRAKLRALEKVS